MSEVASIRPGVAVHDDRRAAFLAHMARSYDAHTAAHTAAHGEPDALVFALGGVAQPRAAYWLILGESENHPRDTLDLFAAHLLRA